MVFLHIPKSGGRSVASFLNAVAEAMNFQQQRTYGNENKHLKISDLKVNQTITFGHFTTKIFDREPSFRQCFTITVLREPVDRAISAFFFHGHKKREIDPCLNAAAKVVKPSASTELSVRNLREYADHNETDHNASNSENQWLHKVVHHERKSGRCRANWQYSNDMTRRLAGSSDNKWNTRAEHRYRLAQPDRGDLVDAKAKLMSEFDAVCFIHDLPSCADQVLNAFQLKRSDERLGPGLSHMTSVVDSKFVTKTRPDELDEDDKIRFIEANLIDLELYDWAVQNA